MAGTKSSDGEYEVGELLLWIGEEQRGDVRAGGDSGVGDGDYAAADDGVDGDELKMFL